MRERERQKRMKVKIMSRPNEKKKKTGCEMEEANEMGVKNERDE